MLEYLTYEQVRTGYTFYIIRKVIYLENKQFNLLILLHQKLSNTSYRVCVTKQLP